MDKRLKYILISLIIIGFILGLNRAWQKHSFEKENRQVELSMSLKELKVVAARGGISLPIALRRLRNESGIVSLAVSENTLATLAKGGRLSYYLGSDILRDLRSGKKSIIFENIKNLNNFNPSNIYVFFDDDSVKEQVINILKRVLSRNQLKQIKPNIWEIRGDEEEITNIGLGFSNAEIKLCQRYGFRFIGRLIHNERFNEKAVRYKLKKIKDIRFARTVIFGGKKILGFPKKINIVAKALKDFGLNFGFVEFAEQEGDRQLYRYLPNNSFKVHSISPEEMEVYTPHRALRRHLRAVRERQVKVLMIHPFLAYDFNENLFDANLKTIKELKEEILSLGYKIIQINKVSFKNVKPLSSFELFIFIIAISSAFIFLIEKFGFKNYVWVSVVFILAIVMFLLFKITGQIILLRKLVALSCAVIFPTLAVITLFSMDKLKTKALKKLIPKAIVYLISVFVITFIGAIIITGLLSDEYFLSGSQSFIGVKAAFLLPLMLVAAYYFWQSIKKQSLYVTFKKIMGSALLKGEVVLGLFLLLFLVVYILRSGNYVVLPFAGVEESFRNFLDKVLVVRPRTKEIFIGFPFIFLTYIYYQTKIRKWILWFFQCISTVGLISLINTFCHIHSPVAISLLRSINGLIVGLVIGFIYLAVIELYFYIERLCSRRL